MIKKMSGVEFEANAVGGAGFLFNVRLPRLLLHGASLRPGRRAQTTASVPVNPRRQRAAAEGGRAKVGGRSRPLQDLAEAGGPPRRDSDIVPAERGRGGGERDGSIACEACAPPRGPGRQNPVNRAPATARL
jgi:hypothetical protein